MRSQRVYRQAGGEGDGVSKALVRQDFLLNRLIIKCRCGETFSLPSEGYSLHTCTCGRTWENGYSDDSEKGKRCLGVHDPDAWQRIQDLRKIVDG
jgi:hypothetical protein